MVEHPACTGFLTVHLQTRLEIVRAQSSLDGQETESVCLRSVEYDGASIEGNGRADSLGNGTEQCFLGEVRDDSVVDIEEAAFHPLALLQRLFRAFSFRNVFRERAIIKRGVLSLPGTRETLLLTQIELPFLHRYCFSI